MLCKRSGQNLKMKLQNDEGTYTDSKVDKGMVFCSDAESMFAIGMEYSNPLLLVDLYCISRSTSISSIFI